jgi:SOS-response transcriptional repressor LexA
MENNNEDFAINFVDIQNKNKGILIKRIRVCDNKYYLCSSNQEYQDIEVTEFDIIGRVKGMLVSV